jgi:hypothetical protein
MKKMDLLLLLLLPIFLFLSERSDEGSCEGNRGPLVAVDMAAVLVELLPRRRSEGRFTSWCCSPTAGIGKRN